jgi:hypothetical protein
MKISFWLFAALTGLCIASADGRQQASQLNESLAYSRLVAASGLPTVTSSQCYSAQGDWIERDKADKEGGPYWYQRVSTEELARMASLSNACATEAVGHERPNATSVGAFVARASQFHYVMLTRAETVLHNHGLVEEFLLQP